MVKEDCEVRSESGQNINMKARKKLSLRERRSSSKKQASASSSRTLMRLRSATPNKYETNPMEANVKVFEQLCRSHV